MIPSFWQEVRCNNVMAVFMIVSLMKIFHTDLREPLNTRTHTHTFPSVRIKIKKQDGGLKETEFAWKIAF